MEHLEIQNAVDGHLHVVARNTDLLGNVDRSFFERVLVADVVDEREENMEPGIEGGRVLSQPLNDVGALLRHDHGGLGENVEDEQRKDQGHEKSAGHEAILHRL